MVFCDFYFFWSNPLWESGCRVSKTEGFLRVFLDRCTPLTENKGRVSKIVFFFDFGVPESVLRIVLTIRFATYGRFLKREKLSENRQNTLKTDVFFCDFFMFEATLCRNPAVECQKLRVFCDFGVPESVLTTCFATYGLLQGCPEVPPRWFQTSLKPV